MGNTPAHIITPNGRVAVARTTRGKIFVGTDGLCLLTKEQAREAAQALLDAAA